VIAKDGTILAGHGVYKAALKLGMKEMPVIRLNIDPDSPRALKVLIGDNEIGHLAEIDDRALTEMLKQIKTDDIDGLLGTGYDESMLANLLFVTRPASEIADMNEAAQWAGMPGYEEGEEIIKLIIGFRTPHDRECFVKEAKLRIDKRESKTWMTRWPFTERHDLASQKFEAPR
jgi:hypothetical protein